MTAAKTIRNIRKTLGLTQVELSEKLEILQGNISAYETGKAKPSPSNAIKLRKFALKHGIDIPLEDFLF